MDSLPQDDTPRKQCTGICGRFLSNTPEFFHRNGGNKLHPQCKECRGKTVKAYYERPEVHAQRVAYTKEYRAENQEYVRAHKKEYYSKPEIKAHKLDYTREYRTRPGVLEKKRAQDKEYLKKPEAREKHRAYDRIFQHTRRARKKAIPGTYTDQQIQEQLKRQKHKCYYEACGHAKFEKRNGKYVYHIEHTFPLSRVVGTDIPANDISYLVLACPHCNSSKNDKFPWEWPEGGRLL